MKKKPIITAFPTFLRPIGGKRFAITVAYPSPFCLRSH